MRVFLTGATGQVGRRLVPALLGRGDQVLVLSRNAARGRAILGGGVEVLEGDPTEPGSWTSQVSGCDAVVNLVGEPVLGRRWHPAFQQLLRDSRTRSTERVGVAIRRAEVRPRVLVQVTAIGYYGFCGDEALTESSPSGTDFLAQLCVDWELAAQPVQEAGVRLVLLRSGVVLDREGGALAQMLPVFRWFLGGRIGSGRQWVSWIHFADEVGLILLALDDPRVRGPVNATAPVPVVNRDLARLLGKVLHRPSYWPTPTLLTRVLFGRGRADVLTKGQRVLPERAQSLGYSFRFPELPAALADLLTRPTTV